jgi:hypothetical protein
MNLGALALMILFARSSPGPVPAEIVAYGLELEAF